MSTMVEKSGDRDIDGLLWGHKWDRTDLTYAFPQSAREYLENPDTGETRYSQIENFEPMSAKQESAIHSIIRKFDAVCALNFTFTDDYGTGNIRFASASGVSYEGEEARKPGNGTAEGIPPSPEFASYSQGDTWYNIADGYDGNEKPRLGEYAYTAIFMHEIGHALGLKHGHEKKPGDAFNDAFPTLPKEHNSQEYSVMTYARYPGDDVDGDENFAETELPTTLMQDDIAALQYLYGAEWKTNRSDTVYKWSSKTGEMFVNGDGKGATAGHYIFLTVWDGGGVDTYDCSNYRSDLKIDLRPGASSTLGKGQLADLDGGAGKHAARGSIFNALQFEDDPRSLIENAEGGRGDDRIVGNQASGALHGNGGSDRITGGVGADELWGGSGRDIFEFDYFKESTADESGQDTIFDFRKNDHIDLKRIDADREHKGNQAFSWIGAREFTGDGGELRFVKEKSDTYVYGDADGDKVADLAIHLDDAFSLSKAYFVL